MLKKYSKLWLLAGLVVMLVVLVACGTAARPQEEALPAKGTDSVEVAKQNEAKTDTSQDILINVVEKSGAAQAKALPGGASVVSAEDVTTPRTHRGGEYHDVSTSDAVSFQPYLTTDTASSSYQAMVYTGGLLRLDENTLEYVPNMAKDVG